MNCISTEFTPKKHGGEKGVPFRIQVETYLQGEGTLKRLHAAACQIKVFKVNESLLYVRFKLISSHFNLILSLFFKIQFCNILPSVSRASVTSFDLFCFRFFD